MRFKDSFNTPLFLIADQTTDYLKKRLICEGMHVDIKTDSVVSFEQFFGLELDSRVISIVIKFFFLLFIDLSEQDHLTKF